VRGGRATSFYKKSTQHIGEMQRITGTKLFTGCEKMNGVVGADERGLLKVVGGRQRFRSSATTAAGLILLRRGRGYGSLQVRGC